MKGVGVIGLAAATAGAYVLGRRHEEVRARVACMFRSSEELAVDTTPTAPTQRYDYDTEFDHLAGTEAAERHRLAEEIKSHPLHERRALGDDEVESLSSQPLKRERDDVLAPRPF